MKNFLIGMWHKFDYKKYERDFQKGFYGVEACMFASIEELKNTLIEKSIEDHFQWGCHYPLIKNHNSTRDPLFLSLDEDERNQAFSDFRKETEVVSSLGGQYILTHFPKPVLINDTFDFAHWRFGNDKEWIYEKDYPIDILEQNLYDMFQKLNSISMQYNIPVVLENDAISEYLYKSPQIETLLKEFSNIKICLDVGRLHLNQCADIKFDGIEFAKKLAPYAYIAHLWNANPDDNLTGVHLPVSPDQKTKNGYADIKNYLDIIFAHNENIKILFEHNSSILTDYELESCYKWVDSIKNK